MASAIDVCNHALDLIGCQSITSLIDGSVEARVCKRMLPIATREVQRLFPWRCIRSRAQLAAEVATPEFGLTYQYGLPSNFLRLIEVFEADGVTKVTDYQLESSKILTDSTAPIHIIYLRYDADVNAWDDLLQSVVAHRLAAKMSSRLTQDTSLRQLCWREYEQVLGEAKRAHAQEMHPVGPDLGNSDWTTAHLRGY